MSMVFHFRMLSDENDNFMRDYQVVYDMNLLQFHKFICQDLGFDAENMCSFFLSNSQWEKTQEFTLMDMGLGDEQMDEGMPRSMEQTLLSQIIKQKHERLIYEFDMLLERALYLELIDCFKQEDDKNYPLVVESEGAAPDQFEPGEVEDNNSIFDDVMSEFNDFSGDDSYDDEY
ncbi:MAG: hypothetical protein R3Y38_06875 [Rikenellaceae bacterium]